MDEWGFWEYTTPGGGACPYYELADWERLLDDMAGARMNSLLLMIKWFTTGYRSRLPWLDQDPECRIIATDNDLLRAVIAAARERDLRVWLGGVCSLHQVKEYGIVPPNGKTSGVFPYDPDYPGVRDRMVALFREIAELFPDVDGLMVEMESVEFDWPHRVPVYNAWAEEHGKSRYGDLRQRPMDARAYQKHEWREFLTERRCLAFKEIEAAVRQTGFTGKLSTILETSSEPGAYEHALDLPQFAAAMPAWAAVTYDYHRCTNRRATMDFCMDQPLALGLPTYFLGRGVMTYAADRLHIGLEENWRRDFADACDAGVTGLWHFGADGVPGRENMHCALGILADLGFADGLAARRRLLEIAADCRPLG